MPAEAVGYPSGQAFPYHPETSAASMLPTQNIPTEVKQKILSFSPMYNKPVRPVVEIYDRDFVLQHTYDSFMIPFHDPTININHVEVVRQADGTSSFDVRFFDHKNEIDKAKISNGAWVIVKGGRDPLKLKS